jgi:DNA-directed RNA polymerase subunit RPC12/RpoP
MSTDPHLATTLYKCSECGGTSSEQAWQLALGAERRRRKADPSFDADDYGPDYGLDDRMVCPRCGYVHADDDSSWVEELRGYAQVMPQ